MFRFTLPFAVLIAASLPVDAAPWTLNGDSEVRFTAYQKGQPVEGRFEAFTADIDLDPDAPDGGTIAVEIDVGTITTGHKDRDAALRSSSFFDAKKWPTASFTSERIERAADGGFEAVGTLTIRDVSEHVVLPFTLEVDGASATASGALTISRLAYGVGQGDFASTSTVGDDVEIHIEIGASRED